MREEQLGHLPREVAAILSPLMQERPDLSVEGFVPKGASNTYTMHVHLAIFGPPEKADAAAFAALLPVLKLL